VVQPSFEECLLGEEVVLAVKRVFVIFSGFALDLERIEPNVENGGLVVASSPLVVGPSFSFVEDRS